METRCSMPAVAAALLRWSIVTEIASTSNSGSVAAPGIPLGVIGLGLQPPVDSIQPDLCLVPAFSPKLRNRMSLERCSIVWKFWDDAARSRRFLMTAATTGWLLVRWLAVAYAIESLMITWLPVGAVGEWLGAGAGPLAVPLAVGIGIPVYLNSCAAIPFISGLIGLGMSPLYPRKGTGLEHPDALLRNWRGEFAAQYKRGRYFHMTLHPQHIGWSNRLQMLDEFLAELREHPSLWNPTAAECARYWLETYPAGTHLRLQPSIWQDYPGSLS